eukprot:1617537-Amphidinium_carterae.1
MFPLHELSKESLGAGEFVALLEFALICRQDICPKEVGHALKVLALAETTTARGGAPIWTPAEEDCNCSRQCLLCGCDGALALRIWHFLSRGLSVAAT